ncbi:MULTISPECIES: hypothetical protein [Streptomycetaceae]|uniref:Uncharacterized protein n=1 Tax=Streptantibioticus cattleyicolor (strain ATCC 35852 / DSM 46488 / JCM 4925 / NBRC 14057 / NRRL 8057) TaxID=1003195 RepID=F8K548_STREN|nr:MULTISPECIES: hypothetical protein [Streptomycetaceae]AEW96593.1 hypothetical protein SCATT_42220 [Streptantibioticus cattleyicolor NRRL 8057 = DSM 46488]MYS61089.1 hypothetical protein [Streptomyces sp. SID5468]CCB76930.1 conserved protein of unknown function [Streptantibioticus cattleyicolor NRRL 8057 = DSM 46488]
MRDDGGRPEPRSEEPSDRASTKPRHAAPRKSFLTRVHVPAGKAIALAAMPTAVLMGMGFTPRLAQADELPKNPFKGDHCVSQSESPSPSPSASTSASPSPSTSASPSPSPSASADRTPTPDAPSGTDKSGGTDKTTGNAHGTNPATTPDQAPRSVTVPSPSPSATKTHNPLDPLGLGDAVGGLLGGLLGGGHSGGGAGPGSGSGGTAPSTSPSPSASPSASDGNGNGGGTTTHDPVGQTVGKVAKGLGDAAGGAGAKDDAGKATPGATPSPSVSAAPTPTEGQAFPCPTYDAKALAGADVEHTPSLLPNQPWILNTDMLTLLGLHYAGIVKVETEDHTVKPVLKFTATSVDIKNLHQITVGPGGLKYHVQAGPGTTSTIRNGTVTMYTEELKGNLFGLIPVTFSPKSPPPIDIPAAFFTNVTVTQAGQFGGTLTVPGLHMFHEG